jgi:hypothetical protein
LKESIFSIVPAGQNSRGTAFPGNELPGCFQLSLRDKIAAGIQSFLKEKKKEIMLEKLRFLASYRVSDKAETDIALRHRTFFT